MSNLITTQIRALTDYVKKDQGKLEFLVRSWLAEKAVSETIEDILSESYFVAASKLTRGPNIVVNNIGAWFRKIVYFHCLKQCARKREFVLSDSQFAMLEYEENMLDALYEGARLDLRQGMSELKTQERSILELFAAGHTTKQIADEKDLSVDNVRKIKSRAIQFLREKLQ